MGGAVATDTHGSSLTHGSLSSREQLLDLWLMNGEGEIVHLNHDINPHLMRAARVSVGRLGVITHLRLRITPNDVLERIVAQTDSTPVIDEIMAIQEAYKETGVVPIDELNNVNFFWYPQEDLFYRVSVIPASEEDLPLTLEEESPDAEDAIDPSDIQARAEDYLQIFTRDDAQLDLTLVDAFARTSDAGGVGAAGSSAWIPEHPPYASMPAPMFTFQLRGFAGRLNRRLFEETQFPPGFFRRRMAYPALKPETPNPISYDQYEVSVPLENAGDCLAGLVALVASIDGGDKILTPPLIRFVAESDAYLSTTSGGPKMYVNMEDYVFYNDNRGRSDNAEFQEAMAFLRTNEACGGEGVSHFHWGKAGWPDEGCFDGATEYAEGWCHFGCAVRVLDPENKFQSDTSVFRWNMAALDACCDDNQGFLFGKAGCQTGCSGDEPRVDLLKAASAPVSVNTTAQDNEDNSATCVYPPVHPSLRYPDRWV